MKFSFPWPVVAIMVACLSACVHKPFAPTSTGPTGSTGSTGATGNTGITTGCSPDTVFFTNTILPILQSNCATSGCHDSISHIEEFNLSTYTNIMQSRVVVPGDTAQSYLYYSITTSGKEGAVMPPSSYAPLSAGQIQAIATWIRQGAKNNTCTLACDTANISYAAAVLPILQSNCYSCHSTANADAQGSGNNLQVFSSLVALANSNKLLCDINQAAGCNAMPLNGSKLSDCDIAKITQWIKIGTPNN